MARNYRRFLTSFTAQASAAITADADSAGAQTDFDTTASGNCDGCEEALIEIDVTVPPSSAASCNVFIQALEFDGVGYGVNKYVGSVAVGTSAGKYYLTIPIIPPQGRIVLHAVSYAFTASAQMRGFYYSDN